MIEVAIMIEGQNGLTWPHWKRIAKIAEDGGFAGLYRSDHFTNDGPPELDSLDCWVSLTWLASHTQRIEFGPLVSPVSFRDPRMLARQAAQIDDLSGGRLRLGVVAGWNRYEHRMFGYDLLDTSARFERFQEGLEIITRLLKDTHPVTFNGRYYQLKDAVLLPRPSRPGGPPIVIGGSGPKRTLPLVVRYADEWNCVYQTPENFQRLNAMLDEMLREAGREPGSVRRTMMTGLAFGRTRQEIEARLRGTSPEQARQRGMIAGTAGEVIDQLNHLGSLGLQRVMLQWLDLENLDLLEEFGKAVVEKVQA